MTAKPIVAGTDGSEESLRAVDWAAREAVLRGLPLRILSPPHPPPPMIPQRHGSGPGSVADTLRKDRERALNTAAERARGAAPELQVDVADLPRAPAYALTEAGSDASMLVVGARGVGAFTALILGSVSQY